MTRDNRLATVLGKTGKDARSGPAFGNGLGCQRELPFRGASPVVLTASGAAVLTLVVVFALIFKMSTPDGTLVIELSDPDVTLEVLDANGKVRIDQKADGKTVEINVVSGTGKLRVIKNGTELLAKEFTLSFRRPGDDQLLASLSR